MTNLLIFKPQNKAKEKSQIQIAQVKCYLVVYHTYMTTPCLSLPGIRLCFRQLNLVKHKIGTMNNLFYLYFIGVYFQTLENSDVTVNHECQVELN